MIDHLKDDGYQIYNSPENQLLGFYNFADVISSAGIELDDSKDILTSCLFPRAEFSEKSVIVDNHVG
ncbi:hypothetical protein ACI3PL_29775, partial [Lacticaseibacillus paracasei]